ncbi:four helix bundle protein [Myroides odoratimimus]|uniref:Four helix bundle protein n=2 Tax=Myroides odoratimimus TaxID=76832 RepID=A0A0S7E802_9FLAO|nr:MULTISPECIES: four helix bundle protein [Myroides]AJA68116.1 four helix bundle protein [Myroides sp. A21]ALU28282.1 four helix bundle protein [Myroides odoratimimus]EHO06781.1 hypothetical protein HMPREF9712_02986 [Myroides odoratimimus CCUG 10230]MCA4805930.1 four helix bundle protein [Myroides odoratimimus]MCO7722083.1 four helix bundle protein [Myroides odoratimimus]
MIDYRNYNVWKLSHELVLKIYPLLNLYPKYEERNLIDQIRRAVVSIPTNIAEGCGKDTQKELVRYLYIASGSAHEVEYLIFLSKDLGYLNENDFYSVQNDIVSIKKMLVVLIKRIRETMDSKK